MATQSDYRPDGLRHKKLYNAHGDVTEHTSDNGTTLKNNDYDAFGVETQPEILDSNPFRYCGEYYDREADTLYLRARSYNANSGRFTTEDPIRDGLNWYAYCGGNPVRFVDPTGYEVAVIGGAAAAGKAIGAAVAGLIASAMNWLIGSAVAGAASKAAASALPQEEAGIDNVLEFPQKGSQEDQRPNNNKKPVAIPPTPSPEEEQEGKIYYIVVPGENGSLEYRSGPFTEEGLMKALYFADTMGAFPADDNWGIYSAKQGDVERVMNRLFAQKPDLERFGHGGRHPNGSHYGYRHFHPNQARVAAPFADGSGREYKHFHGWFGTPGSRIK